MSITEGLKTDITLEESDLAKEKRFVHHTILKNNQRNWEKVTNWFFFLILCRNYEVYQEKMINYKELTELAESSDEINVKIANKMKYYKMLSEESKQYRIHACV